MKLEIKKEKKLPIWANMLIATLPFDYTLEYNREAKSGLLSTIYNHCMEFKYTRRNAECSLKKTHVITRNETCVFVTNSVGNLILTFSFK